MRLIEIKINKLNDEIITNEEENQNFKIPVLEYLKRDRS